MLLPNGHQCVNKYKLLTIILRQHNLAVTEIYFNVSKKKSVSVLVKCFVRVFY
jgi:hypothetical protein